MSEFATDELPAAYGRIRAFLRRRTSAEVADELTQQVFAEAAARLPAWKLDSEVGLLYAIAKRRLIDELRRAGRERLISLDDESDSAPALEYRSELRGALVAAIDALDDKQREVLVMKLIRGLSFAEIAHLTDRSVGACKMRFGRALAEVRRTLEDGGIEP
jgi:RNA polymerase sigma-70 factor (ECF subfamily)